MTIDIRLGRNYTARSVDGKQVTGRLLVHWPKHSTMLVDGKNIAVHTKTLEKA